jgi:hypothetical protein
LLIEVHRPSRIEFDLALRRAAFSSALRCLGMQLLELLVALMRCCCARPPIPENAFLSGRFSIRTSARVSFSWRASALSSLTSSEVASRAVSPVSPHPRGPEPAMRLN